MNFIVTDLRHQTNKMHKLVPYILIFLNFVHSGPAR